MDRRTKIGLFGSTGFIGSYILKELLNAQYDVNVLVRDPVANKSDKIEVFAGDLSATDVIERIVKKSDILIYSVGIISEDRKHGITFEKLHFEYFKRIVDLAKKENVRKIIYISANGVDQLDTEYQTSKYLAEQYLQNNFDNWTIFRPSVVFGDPGDKVEFLTQLKNDIINKPLPVPLFFKINPFKAKRFFRSNPVHVQDLANLIVRSIESDISRNKIHAVGGPTETTWYSMLKEISVVLSKNKLFVPVPVFFLYLAALIFDRLSFFPITASQIKMLRVDNICNSKELFDQYNISPMSFSKANIQYLE